MSEPEAADTRSALLTAARRLLADHGIEPVSLRSVARAAGARNVGAVQYHFGNRDGLVRAVMAPYQAAVEIRRDALLDEYQASGGSAVLPLAAALVRPWAAELATVEGRQYLRILGHALGQIPPMEDLLTSASLVRWRDLLEPLLSPNAVRLHRRFTSLRFAAYELAARARIDPSRDNRLFESQLIDLVAGLLLAPVSDETRRRALSRTAPASAPRPAGQDRDRAAAERSPRS